MMVRRSRAGLLLATLLAIAALTAALVGQTLAAHARRDATEAASRAIVQVTAPDDDAATARAASRLQRLDGVLRASPISRAQAAALMEAAGAGPVDPQSLPAPRLVEVSRAPDLADSALTAALREAGLSAVVFTAPAPPESPLARADMAGLAFALTLLLALGLATGPRVSGPDATLAADLGQARGEALAQAGREGFRFGFDAGLAGAGATAAGAAGVLIMTGHPLSLADMMMRISPAEAALVLLAPLASGGAATLGARIGAAAAYDRADRLG